MLTGPLSLCGCGIKTKFNGLTFPALVDEREYFSPPASADGVTLGGVDGEIVKVTSLESEGEGSLREALAGDGRRVIVFEVGGIIDLAGKNLVLNASYVTIAGQTAPPPGITIIRGGIAIKNCNDVFVQHIGVRPGDLGDMKREGRQIDALSIIRSRRIVIDHCSLSWAIDENVGISGPPFQGNTKQHWRENTSSNIVVSNCIISECLNESTHPKGSHSMGLLIHENVRNVVIYRNLLASNDRRHPVVKGGVSASIINNLIYNPGRRAIHYAMRAHEWGERTRALAFLDIKGNVVVPGPDTVPSLVFFKIEDEFYANVSWSDNMLDDSFVDPPKEIESLAASSIIEMSDISDTGAVDIVPTSMVEAMVLACSGARPWDRDNVDKRIVSQVKQRTGKIIDSQSEVGGYPKANSARSKFDPSHWEWSQGTLLPKPSTISINP